MQVSLNSEFKLMIRGTPPPGRDFEFEEDLARKIPTVAWHKGWKLWWAPLGLGACRALGRMGAHFDSELTDWVGYQEKLAACRGNAAKLQAYPVEKVKEALSGMGVRFKEKPFNHQVYSLAWAFALPACGLFLDTGLGKTCVGAMLMQALVDLQNKKRFLVIAPRTLLNTAWKDDLEKFSWLTHTNLNQPHPADMCPVCDRQFNRNHVPWSHIKGHFKAKIRKIAKIPDDLRPKDMTAEQKDTLKRAGVHVKEGFLKAFPQFKTKSESTRVERIGIKLNKTDVNVYLINPESFRLAFDEIMSQEWDGIIIDESSILKDPSSQTTQKLIRIGMKIKRKVIMSATPRPNSSLEWQPQMAFLDMCLGSSFRAYREKFFKQIDKMGYIWGPKAGAEKTIRDIVFQRCIRYRLEDCVDLPGETYENHEVELTDECRRAYDEMAKDYVLQLKSGERVEGFNPLVVTNKLSQLASGFIFDQEGEHHLMPNAPKIKHTIALARRLVEQEGHSSVCIWVRFSRIEARLIADGLRDLGVSEAHGHSRDTDEAIVKFKDGRNKIMIANAQSVGFGHTWTHCNACIFHSYGHSWEQYYQAKRRFVRISQKKPVLYVNVIARDTVDEDIIKAVSRKERQSERIIDEMITNRLMEKYDE